MAKSTYRCLLAALTLGLVGCVPRDEPAAALPANASWEEVVDAAKGQTVYWNAWAGDERINGYIEWAAKEVDALYGVRIVHVKIQDVAEPVARVLAEKAAGRTSGGSVDMIWINGENFAALKRGDMLHGPFVADLPNAGLIDFAQNPAFTVDFTIPTDGLEAPWGQAMFVFNYDSARVDAPPRDFPDLLQWAAEHPGRFTYPAPPNFTGSTFLKQAVLALAPEEVAFDLPPDDASFAKVWEPLSAYLDELHPHLWRRGQNFPASGPAQRQLLADGEVDIAMAFNPAEARSAIMLGQLPPTVMTYGFTTGSISNAHFLAIPANARAREGALVVINFLLSPEAQAKKADIRVWGDAPVLSMARLSPMQRDLFDLLGKEGNMADWNGLGQPLSEPHPQWMERLEKAWADRYAR